MKLWNPFRRSLPEQVRRAHRKYKDAQFEFDKWAWSYKPSHYEDEVIRIEKLFQKLNELERKENEESLL